MKYRYFVVVCPTRTFWKHGWFLRQTSVKLYLTTNNDRSWNRGRTSYNFVLILFLRGSASTYLILYYQYLIISGRKLNRLSYLPLRWRHNGRDGISNHQPHDCLLNRLFGADQSKHQSSASLAFVWGIHRGRWIPHTNGQLRRKCFHLMTSSCHEADDEQLRRMYYIIYVVLTDIYYVGVADSLNGTYQLCTDKPRKKYRDLTNCGLVTPYGDIELGQHWLG